MWSCISDSTAACVTGHVHATAPSHLLGSIYNALCNDIALHDAAKDVDQERLDLLVTCQNVEGSHHLQAALHLDVATGAAWLPLIAS